MFVHAVLQCPLKYIFGTHACVLSGLLYIALRPLRINDFLAQQTSPSVWLGGTKLEETPIHYVIPVRAGRSGVRIFAGVGDLFLLRNVKDGSGAHSRIPGFLCGEKAAGADLLLMPRLTLTLLTWRIW